MQAPSADPAAETRAHREICFVANGYEPGAGREKSFFRSCQARMQRLSLLVAGDGKTGDGEGRGCSGAEMLRRGFGRMWIDG